MNDFLDMRTLIFVSGTTSIFLCLCMTYVYLRRKTYVGFLQWTAAFFSLAAGMICVSLRDIFPDFLTIVIANLGIVLFIALIAHGMIAFAGRKPANLRYLAALTLYLLLQAYFTYVRYDVNMRIVIFSAATALFSAHAAIITYRYVPDILPNRNWFLILFFIFNGAWMLLRAIMTLISGEKIYDLMSSGLIHKLTIMISIEIAILGAMGLLILNMQRVAHELTVANSEIKTLQGFLPICASCKKIRDDQGYWNQIESYLYQHADIEFSHGICPECLKQLYPDLMKDDATTGCVDRNNEKGQG